MKRFTAISALLLGLLLTTGCLQQNGEVSVESQAWTLIEKGALLVDVRTEQEYSQGHLDNAMLIPHDQIASRISELGSDKERQIVLYCRSGGRAGKAEQVLRENGFSNVLNAGGYEGMIAIK